MKENSFNLKSAKIRVDKMRTLSSTFNSIQKYLFPVLEEEIGKLTEKQREFVRTVELIEPERFMDSHKWSGFGRPPSKRQNIFKAYIAKSVYKLSNDQSVD